MNGPSFYLHGHCLVCGSWQSVHNRRCERCETVESVRADTRMMFVFDEGATDLTAARERDTPDLSQGLALGRKKTASFVFSGPRPPEFEVVDRYEDLRDLSEVDPDRFEDGGEP